MRRLSEEELNRLNELISERGKAMVIKAVSLLSDDDDYDHPNVEAGNHSHAKTL
jgi:hypothetical protein